MTITMNIQVDTMVELIKLAEAIASTGLMPSDPNVSAPAPKGIVEAAPTTPVAAEPATRKPAAKRKETAKEQPAEEPAVPAEQPTQRVTLEQIRTRLTPLLDAGKHAQVKALLAEFDAKSATSLKPEDYPAFIAKLSSL